MTETLGPRELPPEKRPHGRADAWLYRLLRATGKSAVFRRDVARAGAWLSDEPTATGKPATAETQGSPGDDGWIHHPLDEPFCTLVRSVAGALHVVAHSRLREKQHRISRILRGLGFGVRTRASAVHQPPGGRWKRLAPSTSEVKVASRQGLGEQGACEGLGWLPVVVSTALAACDPRAVGDIRFSAARAVPVPGSVGVSLSASVASTRSRPCQRATTSNW